MRARRLAIGGEAGRRFAREQLLSMLEIEPFGQELQERCIGVEIERPPQMPEPGPAALARPGDRSAGLDLHQRADQVEESALAGDGAAGRQARRLG